MESIARIIVLTLTVTVMAGGLILAVMMILDPIGFVERYNAVAGDPRWSYQKLRPYWVDFRDPEKMRGSRWLRLNWQITGGVFFLFFCVLLIMLAVKVA